MVNGSRPIFRRAGSLILCGRWEGQTRKWQFSSIKSECMEINGKFLVGFRNYNKDKQVSVIVCENSINSIVNESLSSKEFFYKSRSWLLLYTRAGFPCSPANKKTQLLFAIDSWVDSSNLMCSIDHRWLESVIIHTASLEANKFYILYIMFCFRLMISWYTQ